MYACVHVCVHECMCVHVCSMYINMLLMIMLLLAPPIVVHTQTSLPNTGTGGMDPDIIIYHIIMVNYETIG